MRTFDILVAGEINPDLVLTGDVVPVFDQVEKLVDNVSLTIGSREGRLENTPEAILFDSIEVVLDTYAQEPVHG